jgi:hypothetical protein
MHAAERCQQLHESADLRLNVQILEIRADVISDGHRKHVQH